MSTEKIQLKSIKLEALNSECLLAANRCVRYIKQRHTKVLRLQDKDVLMEISRTVRDADDPELSEIYNDMKSKMLSCVNELRIEQAEKESRR